MHFIQQLTIKKCDTTSCHTVYRQEKESKSVTELVADGQTERRKALRQISFYNNRK